MIEWSYAEERMRKILIKGWFASDSSGNLLAAIVDRSARDGKAKPWVANVASQGEVYARFATADEGKAWAETQLKAE